MKKLLTIAALFVLSDNSSRADIVANFTDGNGTSSVDQFSGIGGSGWVAGWTVGTSSASHSPTVINTTPLNSGDNYLNVPAMLSESAATGVARVGRQYTETGSDVDLDALYTISFDYRADTALGASDATDSGANRYNILGSIAGSSSTSGNNTWIAGVYAGTNGATNDKPIGFGNVNVGHWVFLDNPGTTTVSMAGMNFVDSQISLTVGAVYHFDIEIDPVSRKYRPSVSDGTTSYTAPSFLGFRNQSTTASTFMQFHAFMTTASASLAYSVDSISIQPGSLTQPTGDFDGDGDVDGADFIAWQTNFPTNENATLAQGDADEDGDVDGADFAAWQSQFPTGSSPGASPVPEPWSLMTALLGAIMWPFLSRSRLGFRAGK